MSSVVLLFCISGGVSCTGLRCTVGGAEATETVFAISGTGDVGDVTPGSALALSGSIVRLFGFVDLSEGGCAP